MNKRHFEIELRPSELGGGWRLKLMQDWQTVRSENYPPEDHKLAYLTAWQWSQACSHGHANRYINCSLN